MKTPILLYLSLAALLGLAACNAPAYNSRQDFNAAGQNLGNGNIGAGAADTGHAFSQGANATGQAITTTAHQAGNSF
jgi:hypothetical protein